MGTRRSARDERGSSPHEADGADRTALWASTMEGHVLDRAVRSAGRPRDELRPDGGRPAAGARRAGGATGRDPRAGRRPGLSGRGTGRDPRSRTLCGRVSSVTATGFSTRPPSAAWRARPRSSSSPDDHQRTRLTHALEVAQVAVGDRPGLPPQRGPHRGHRPRPRLRPRPGRPRQRGRPRRPTSTGGSTTPRGGPTSSLAPLNLCAETLDGVRNHSWSRPAPATPEGEVVSWADRIAYVCHDFEDAVRGGIVSPRELPASSRERCGDRRGAAARRVHRRAWSRPSMRTGTVGMDDDRRRGAGRLPGVQLRAHLPAARLPRAGTSGPSPARGAGRDLRRRAGTPAGRPGPGVASGTPGAVRAAVEYVAGMTDRFAVEAACRLLDWPEDELPARYLSPRRLGECRFSPFLHPCQMKLRRLQPCNKDRID